TAACLRGCVSWCHRSEAEPAALPIARRHDLDDAVVRHADRDLIVLLDLDLLGLIGSRVVDRELRDHDAGVILEDVHDARRPRAARQGRGWLPAASAPDRLTVMAGSSLVPLCSGPHCWAQGGRRFPARRGSTRSPAPRYRRERLAPDVMTWPSSLYSA